MKHGFARYSPEINSLRAVQGAVADLRHEAGQIPDGGTGWEYMDVGKGAENMTLDQLIEAFDYAINCAESPALKEVRRYIDDMYDGECTVGGVVRKAKTVRATLLRIKKEQAA